MEVLQPSCRITSVPRLLLQDHRRLHIEQLDTMIAGLSYSKLLRMATAEMVAVFLVMFSVCGATIANKRTQGDTSLLVPAAAGGLSVMVMVFAVGHISGAHLNPVVTLAFASRRAFPLQIVPVYLLAQFLGSLLAVGVLQALTHDAAAALTVPSASAAEAFVVELVLGFNLMFVATSVSTGSSNSGELAGIAVGATVTLNVLLGGAISGAAMSPLRSLGPAIVANKYDNVWIYVIAPPIGALAGTWTRSLIQVDHPCAA